MYRHKNITILQVSIANGASETAEETPEFMPHDGAA
jgi:hypothetical protein